MSEYEKRFEIAPGQIWRDTYGDGKPVCRGATEIRHNLRTVRVVEQQSDGRWLVELVTNGSGRPPKSTARQTRVSERTFRTGYELQSDTALALPRSTGRDAS